MFGPARSGGARARPCERFSRPSLDKCDLLCRAQPRGIG